MHAFPCVHFDPCDGKKRAVSLLTLSPSKHLGVSMENLTGDMSNIQNSYGRDPSRSCPKCMIDFYFIQRHGYITVWAHN